jgi:PBSX family phage terminase large subunit
VDLSRVTSVLSPKQIRSIADAQARINLWDGAIRSGKTIASLLAWLIFVATAPASGELVVVAKTSITASRNVFGPLMDFALFGELAGQTTYTTGAPYAVILGRRVWVIGANDIRAETRLRGLTCCGCYVDEASLVPQQFFTQLLGRMSVPGARMFATTNPDTPAHWLRRDFLARAGALNLLNWHFVLADNPSLTAEYIAAISAEFTGLWYKRFILGQWVAAEGAVYDMFDEAVHVVDNVPPITTWLTCAIDYGTTNPFHAILLGIGAEADPRTGARRENLYGVAEWRWDSRQQHRQLTDLEYSVKLREWLQTVRFPGTRLHGPRPEYLVIDPSAASFKQQAYQDGWTVADGDNAVLDGIRLISSLLSAGRLKFSRSGCPAVIDEFPAYSWDDKAALAGEDKVVKVGDHGLDATRYGIKTTQPLWHSRIRLAA